MFLRRLDGHVGIVVWNKIPLTVALRQVVVMTGRDGLGLSTPVATVRKSPVGESGDGYMAESLH